MRSGGSFSRCDEALDVFREDIHFDVDCVIDGHRVDVGVLMREGNDGDVGDAIVRMPAGDGEADTVDGDRTFFDDVAAQILRDADGEPPVVAFGDERRDAPDSVDVALNEMAAEASGGGKWALEIHGLAGFFFAEGCAAESFAGEIGGERAGVELDHGEAAT